MKKKFFAERIKKEFYEATDGIYSVRRQQLVLEFIHIRARHRASKYWITTFAVTSPIMIGIGLFISSTNFPQYMLFLMVCLFGALLTLPSHLLEKRFARQMMSDRLRKKRRRPKICLLCGYSLAGSTSSSCPECGELLAPPSDPTQDPMP